MGDAFLGNDALACVNHKRKLVQGFNVGKNILPLTVSFLSVFC